MTSEMSQLYAESYKRGRSAIKRLTEKTKKNTFTDWCDYGNAILSVRAEAMRIAGCNQAVGKAYNLQHAKIMKREDLAAFDGKTRQDAIEMVENLRHPADMRRLKGIEAWRAALDPSERARTQSPDLDCPQVEGQDRTDCRPRGARDRDRPERKAGEPAPRAGRQRRG